MTCYRVQVRAEIVRRTTGGDSAGDHAQAAHDVAERLADDDPRAVYRHVEGTTYDFRLHFEGQSVIETMIHGAEEWRKAAHFAGAYVPGWDWPEHDGWVWVLVEQALSVIPDGDPSDDNGGWLSALKSSV